MTKTQTIPGVFMRLFNRGVLITGKAGSGKSTLALGLIDRGHQLIADDAVEFSCIDNKTIIGQAPHLLRHLLEVRGIGIIDLRKHFSSQAYRNNCPLNYNFHFQESTMQLENRIDCGTQTFTLFDRAVPQLMLNENDPAITVRTEVMVKELILREQGNADHLDFCQQQAESIQT